MFTLQDGREHLYQWDLDRYIIVNDANICEVHFCNRTSDCSLVVEVKDGLAAIPNILLQDARPIRVYAYCDNKYTLTESQFTVKSRTKPSDYIYTETEINSYDEIDARLTELEENIESVIAEEVTNYIKDNPIEVDISGKADIEHTHTLNEIIDYTEPDLSEYAKKEDIPDVSSFIAEIPAEYITESELEAKGYVTSIDAGNIITSAQDAANNAIDAASAAGYNADRATSEAEVASNAAYAASNYANDAQGYAEDAERAVDALSKEVKQYDEIVKELSDDVSDLESKVTDVSNEIKLTETYDFLDAYNLYGSLRKAVPSGTQVGDTFTFFIPMGWEVAIQLFNADGTQYYETISATNTDEVYKYVIEKELPVNSGSFFDAWKTGESVEPKDCPVTFTRERDRIGNIEKEIGDIDTALDELHTYAQALIGGNA